MDRIILAGLVILALFGSAITAHADDEFTKDEITEYIWEDMWHGKDDDGREFPEASFKRHLLTDWVNDNYGSDEYDWSNLGELKYEYADYYDEITEEWSFHDDENGGWTIEDEDGEIYRFELIQGEWAMIDSNGNTVDAFEPFSTLDEDTADYISDDNGRTGAKVDGSDEAHRKAEEWTANEVTTTTTAVPPTADPSQTNAESRTGTTDDNEDNSSNLRYLAAGAALLAVIGILAAVTKRRK